MKVTVVVDRGNATGIEFEYMPTAIDVNGIQIPKSVPLYMNYKLIGINAKCFIKDNCLMATFELPNESECLDRYPIMMFNSITVLFNDDLTLRTINKCDLLGIWLGLRPNQDTTIKTIREQIDLK